MPHKSLHKDKNLDIKPKYKEDHDSLISILQRIQDSKSLKWTELFHPFDKAMSDDYCHQYPLSICKQEANSLFDNFVKIFNNTNQFLEACTSLVQNLLENSNDQSIQENQSLSEKLVTFQGNIQALIDISLLMHKKSGDIKSYSFLKFPLILFKYIEVVIKIFSRGLFREEKPKNEKDDPDKDNNDDGSGGGDDSNGDDQGRPDKKQDSDFQSEESKGSDNRKNDQTKKSKTSFGTQNQKKKQSKGSEYERDKTINAEESQQQTIKELYNQLIELNATPLRDIEHFLEKNKDELERNFQISQYEALTKAVDTEYVKGTSLQEMDRISSTQSLESKAMRFGMAKFSEGEPLNDKIRELHKKMIKQNEKYLHGINQVLKKYQPELERNFQISRYSDEQIMPANYAVASSKTSRSQAEPRHVLTSDKDEEVKHVQKEPEQIQRENSAFIKDSVGKSLPQIHKYASYKDHDFNEQAKQNEKANKRDGSLDFDEPKSVHPRSQKILQKYEGQKGELIPPSSQMNRENDSFSINEFKYEIEADDNLSQKERLIKQKQRASKQNSQNRMLIKCYNEQFLKKMSQEPSRTTKSKNPVTNDKKKKSQEPIVNLALQEESKQQINKDSQIQQHSNNPMIPHPFSALNSSLFQDDRFEEVRQRENINQLTNKQNDNSQISVQQCEKDNFQALMKMITNDTIKLSEDQLLNKQMSQINQLRIESQQMVNECKLQTEYLVDKARMELKYGIKMEMNELLDQNHYSDKLNSINEIIKQQEAQLEMNNRALQAIIPSAKYFNSQLQSQTLNEDEEVDSQVDNIVCESLDSMSRRQKLSFLQDDYGAYLQKFHGIFTLRCQIMNSELTRWKDKINLTKRMNVVHNFKQLQNEYFQDAIYNGYKTIVIDVQNVFVAQIELDSKDQLDQLQSNQNFEQEYIVILKSVTQMSNKPKQNKQANQNIQQENCCQYFKTDQCICHLFVFQIRPYTYEFLRNIEPFFELVVFSKMHHRVLEIIIKHIEAKLNHHSQDMIVNYIKNSKLDNSQREKFRKMKVYAHFILNQQHYIHIEECNQYVENLFLLTKNRSKQSIMFISSNPFSIVTAIHLGFNSVPIDSFDRFSRDDFQLNLLENYILQIRNRSNLRPSLLHDFAFLVEKIVAKSENNLSSSHSQKVIKQTDIASSNLNMARQSNHSSAQFQFAEFNKGMQNVFAWKQGIQNNSQKIYSYPQKAELKHDQKYKCLIASDAKFLLLSNKLVLEQCKIEAICVKNGLKAFELVTTDQYQFDVIILDLFMPIMDGLTAASKIKSHFNEKSRLFSIVEPLMVACTNHLSDSDKQQCIDAGFDICLLQPLTVTMVNNNIIPFISKDKLELNRNLSFQMPMNLRKPSNEADYNKHISNKIRSSNNLSVSVSDGIKSNLSNISSQHNPLGKYSKELPSPDFGFDIEFRSSKQICDCRPRILLVDDNEYNMMPLRFFIKNLKIDLEVLKIVVPNFKDLIGFSSYKSDYKIKQKRKQNGSELESQSFLNEKAESQSGSVSEPQSHHSESGFVIEPQNKRKQAQIEKNYLNQLERHFVIDEAKNGQEAVEKFQKNLNTPCCSYAYCQNQKYKLIVMDLFMPVMDGFEATEQILQLQREYQGPRKPQCNIVALTADHDQKTIDKSLQVGIKQVFHKPVNKDQFKNIVYLYHVGLTGKELDEYLHLEALQQAQVDKVQQMQEILKSFPSVGKLIEQQPNSQQIEQQHQQIEQTPSQNKAGQ